MPRYKLADVVLDLAEIERRPIFCRWNGPVTWWCHWPQQWWTCHYWISWCRPWHTRWIEYEVQPGCPGGSKIDLEHIFDDWDDPRELEGLKEQMAVMLDTLATRQKVLDLELQPKTKQEAEEIGKALAKAQDDLARRKF
jgi:hypothetical protein